MSGRRALTVAARLFADRGRALLWWCVGFVAFLEVNVVFYPSVKDQSEFDQMMNEMPESLRVLMGITEDLSITSPVADSYAAAVAQTARAALEAGGHSVDWLDLYAEDFDPRLTAAERAGYFAEPYDTAAVAGDVARLQAAEALVLVFPQWWFNMPAILKGWFDRVWAPGTAYDNSPDFGPMLPRLHTLREVLAVTTMGSPAWVDWLVLRRPVRRILSLSILKPCAPKARLTWRALHSAEAIAPDRVARFEARLAADITRIAGRLTCPD